MIEAAETFQLVLLAAEGQPLAHWWLLVLNQPLLVFLQQPQQIDRNKSSSLKSCCKDALFQQ